MLTFYATHNRLQCYPFISDIAGAIENRSYLMLALFTLCLLTTGRAFAVGPDWGGNVPTHPERGAMGWPQSLIPNDGPTVLSIKCPKAFLYLRGDLLPVDWKAPNQGAPLTFIKSEGQFNELYYIDLMAGATSDSHVSVRRIMHAGYRCQTAGSLWVATCPRVKI